MRASTRIVFYTDDLVIPCFKSVEIDDPDSLLMPSSNKSVDDSTSIVPSSLSPFGKCEVFQRFTLVQMWVLGSYRVSYTLFD
jgi:hypothetical protein